MSCQIWHSLLELLNLQAKATMFLTEIKITADFSQEEATIFIQMYREGKMLALNEIRSMEIDLVILQSRSPTCAVKNIYDGSFTGKLIKGQGLFAQALIEAGYKVLDSEDF